MGFVFVSSSAAARTYAAGGACACGPAHFQVIAIHLHVAEQKGEAYAHDAVGDFKMVYALNEPLGILL